MSIEQAIFYFFAAVLIFAGGRVITARNPVHAALFLVLAFFNAACLWMLAEAEFLAISLVLVYVGAVMVLFLFVVMMLDLNLDQLREGFARYLPVGALVALVMVGQMGLIVWRNFNLDKIAAPARHGADYNNTRELGMVLYTDYVYSFEIAAVLLLVAIVAAIALTLRDRVRRKGQVIDRQVRTRRSDRVRLVKMAAEKKA